jgi:hypothetical protein
MDQNENRVKTALITGAMTGLGPAYVEYFGRLGYSLILTGKEKKAIRIFAQEAEETYKVPVTGLAVDLSDPKGLSMVYKQTDLVGIDALVNNAADEDGERYAFVDSTEAKRLLALQMNTVVSLTLAVLRRMINRNEGIIVNISPDGIARASAGSRMQASSRVFVRQFTEGLSAQLIDTGIRIQAVGPGTIAPLIAMFGNRQDKQARVKSGANGCEPQDIVETAMKEMECGKSLYTYISRRGLFSKRSEYFAG